jgi:hypothetical protein
MVRTPLLNILGRRLPAVLVGRYRGADYAFWIDAFNTLLGELEMLNGGPWMMDRVILRYEDLAVFNPMPVGLSKVESAWQSTGEDVKIWPSSTGFEIDGSVTLPATSELVAGGFVVRLRNEANRTWFDHAFENVFQAGDGCEISRGNPAEKISSWTIAKVGMNTDPAAYSIAVPGEQGEYPGIQADDIFNVYRTYLVVEGTKRLMRATSVNSLSPLGPQWDDLFATGLRARGEVQTDQNSRDADLWERKWQQAKAAFAADGAHYNSRQLRPAMPRMSMPRRF